MTTAEKIELGLVPLGAVAAWLAAPALPTSLPAGNLIMVCAGIILLQSLVRDLTILARMRGRESSGPKRAARCMCVESALGATGVLAGAVILGAGIGHDVSLNPISWALTVGLVMALGFAIKDLVFEWSP